MIYVGIDVGEKKYYIAWYESRADIRTEKCLKHASDVYEFLKNKNAIVAIDAPSGPCQRIDGKDKRACEEELGIGGFFKTPCEKKLARPWMKSGFELWKFLEEKQFNRAKRRSCDSPARPLRSGDLIEVHPTVIFKYIENTKNFDNREMPPRLWIHSANPVSKRKSKGKQKRKQMLAQLFPCQKEKINKMGIDHIDALIAAHTAEMAHICFGNPDEGQIWFPKVSLRSDKNKTVKAKLSFSRPKDESFESFKVWFNEVSIFLKAQGDVGDQELKKLWNDFWSKNVLAVP